MAQFLHEYSRYPNGKIIDNGWWEIRGNRLYNRRGGHHDYTPMPDDEIREATWDEIVREEIVDNTKTTGWIAPDGTFYGCSTQDHSLVAQYVFNSDERSLERAGYVKIYEVPYYLRIKHPEYDRYEYIRGDGHRATEAQILTLKEKGLEIYHSDIDLD